MKTFIKHIALEDTHDGDIMGRLLWPWGNLQRDFF